MSKKRLIVDYKNVPETILEEIARKYPDGYDNAIIKFKNANGDSISAVAIETEENYYLVKVSVHLRELVEEIEFDDDDDDDDDYGDEDIGELDENFD